MIHILGVASPLLCTASKLTRFAIQAKGPDGKWTRKSLAYRESNNVHPRVTRPPEICVHLVFKQIHTVLGGRYHC